MDHLSTDIQRIPAPLLQPEYQPVEIEQLNECHFAFFDVETTGLGRDSHIVQLSVSVDSNEEIFNCYIKPGKKISPAASTVTGIQFENGKMYHNTNPNPNPNPVTGKLNTPESNRLYSNFLCFWQS